MMKNSRFHACLGPVMAFSAPAFAAPKTQAACEKAGMHWDQTAKKCSKGI